MIRTLFIIAGGALVLCVATLAGAAALGGSDLARHDWTWVVDDTDGHDGFRMRRGEPEPNTTRTLAWSGGDRLIVDMPADVTYIQGSEAGVTVTGPVSMVGRVRLVDSRLIIDDNGPEGENERGYVRWGPSGLHVWSTSEALKITVIAPAVNRFEVPGSGDLTIRGYDQPTLSVSVQGSGDVDGDGKARTLALSIDGSGDVDLGRLEVTDAKVELSGSGDAVIAATGQADVSTSGSGDVDLAARPARLISSATGSGDIDQS